MVLYNNSINVLLMNKYLNGFFVILCDSAILNVFLFIGKISYLYFIKATLIVDVSVHELALEHIVSHSSC